MYLLSFDAAKSLFLLLERVCIAWCLVQRPSLQLPCVGNVGKSWKVSISCSYRNVKDVGTRDEVFWTRGSE
jgi:hypothetical protein